MSTSVNIPAAVPEAADSIGAVRFDTKVVILLRNDLAGWQQLNVAAFLMKSARLHQ